MSGAAAAAATADKKETDYSLANPNVLTAYKAAGDISTKVLKELIPQCKAGVKILDICIEGDKLLTAECAKIYKGKSVIKGIGFPTSISVNHVAAHFSPLPSDPEAQNEFKEGDLVKLSLGAQIDGFGSILGDTFVVGGGEISGRKADVIAAAHLASEAAIRLIKPGGKNWDVTDAVQKIAESFGCKPCEGILLHNQERNVVAGKKEIILNPSENIKRETHSFEQGEVYGVDILISTGEGKVKRMDCRTTVFKRASDLKYSLKMPTSRKTLSEIDKAFGAFPFTLRSLADEKTARIGVIEPQKHGLLQAYEVFEEKNGEFVALAHSTIALAPNGTVRLAGPISFDADKVKSSHSLEDEELKALIAKPLKAAKKKAKKSAGGAAEGQAATASSSQ
ncbi:hypothetical protein PYCC9005_001558 [Savitreella phatthalungensis]